MLGALGAAMGYFSPLLCRVFPGNAVSPSPAAPLCWAFCLPPREPVGPAELCAQGLRMSFSEPVLLAVVACRQPGRLLGCVADLRCFGLGLVADPLLWVCARGQPATDLVARSPRSFLSVLPGSRALIRAPAHPGFQVWAPGH